MQVGEACHVHEKLHFVYENQPISDLDELLLLDQNQFVVLNKDDKFAGVIDRQSLRHAKRYEEKSQTMLATDLMINPLILHHHDSLKLALQRMIAMDKNQLFLVEDGVPVSYLRKQDIMVAYDQRMHGLTLSSNDIQAHNIKPIDSSKTMTNIKSIHHKKSFDSKESLLHFFAQIIAEDVDAKPNDIKASLISRENLGSTAMGGGIAFPHPKERESIFGSGGIAIIHLDQAIDYQAYDMQPVDIFILLWSGNAQLHIESMAKMAGLCKQTQFLEAVKNNLSIDELNQVIQLIEDKDL